MTTPDIPLHALRDLADAALADGKDLDELTVLFDGLARDLAHPAALLDAGMVFLALNRPYARMVGLPPSAIVGKDYAKVHPNKKDMLNILQCNAQGEVCDTELLEPVEADGEALYRRRSVAPVRNADALVLAMLVEYHNDTAPPRDA